MINQRLKHMIRKEFRQTLREPRARAMLIVPPLVQLLVFGFAVNLDVNTAIIGWMDQDQTPQSRALLADFRGSGRFSIAALPSTEKEMTRLLDTGQVEGVVRVLPGFARDLTRGRPTSVQVLVDGTNSNSAQIISGYASATVARFTSVALIERQRGKAVAATGPISAAAPQLSSQGRVWFNQELKSRNYFVPGVIVNIITLVTLSLTAMAIVREKEIGTMEQLMVTPITPIELILGKTIPFALIGFFDTFLVVAAALFLFNVPFRGNFFVLMVCSGLFLLTTLGAGLFVSTVCRTQQQAMMSTFLL